MSGLRVTSLFCLLAGTVFAQGDRGAITGTITDPANAVIPGAVVTATNVESGSVHRTNTTGTGNYTLSQLPAGRYSLAVEADGFNRHLREGIRIFVAQTARIDVTMQLGATAESVTVTGDAPLLRTESAEQSSTITRENFDSLPLNFGARGNFAAANIRNPYMFASLVPGGSLSFYTSIKLNGAPLNSFQIRLEGQESNNNRLMIRVDQVQPSVESLEEISVQTSNFAAEYGQVSGGLFNLTAKSGTNQFHGSAFEYFVNEALNAGQPYTDAGNGEHVKPRNRRHNFGGSIGGPIVRNKTFFNFSLEIFKQKELVSGRLRTVPTDAMRGGDFGAALTGRQLATDPLGRPILENTIYDPLTTRIENGARIRDPFLNNIIPASRFDSVAEKVQSYIPRATRPGIINNWDQSYDADTQKNIATIKVDHNFSDEDKVSVYYSRYWGPHFNGSDGLPIPITRVRRFATRTNTVRVNYNRTITPTVLLHLGAGFLRHYNPDLGLPEVLEFDAAGELSLTGLLRPGFPSIGAMFTGTGGGMQIPIGSPGSIPATTKPTAVASLNWVRNNHTLKFGGDWRIDGLTNRNVAGAIPSYSFNAQQTALPSTQGQNLSGGSVGLPYASFLLGAVNNATISNPPDPQGRQPSLSLFAQDNWKITPRLTLDYGLRWDRQGFPREIHLRTAMFDPNIPNPSAGGLLGATSYEGDGPGRCNCRFTRTYNYGFGPRLGLAYQITPKTVLRAGWGFTYASATGGNSTVGGTLGAGGWNTLNFETVAFGDAALQFEDGLQYDRAVLFQADHDPGIRPSPGLINTPSPHIDRNAGRMPRVNQWSVSLQREITPNLVLEVAYVGNRGVWYGGSSNNTEAVGRSQLIDINALTAARLQSFGLDINNAVDRQLLRSRLDSPLAISRGFGNLPYEGYSPANTVAQSLRPYPQFGNLLVNGAPLDKTWYDSLQVKLTKRYSHGLDLLSTFTWQKELTTKVPINDVFNRRNQKGLSNLSEPLILVVAANYRVPSFGGGGWLTTLLKDWTVGAILRYASSMPIPVPRSQNQLSALLFRDTVMNRVPGEPLYLKDINGDVDPNRDFVLNPAAWEDPPAGQFGVSAPYYSDYRYARRPDEQISFGRVFQIKEGMSFSIRAEFFNTFNRISMNNPSTTNPLQTQRTNSQGVPTAGFGRIDSGSLYGPARNGQIVARFQF